jgi:TetR/AcrR family transcriptional repressor of nem operon
MVRKTPSKSVAAKERSTPDRILDAAEQLVQTRGFNGISYADIAEQVGVTKANLHHHFGSKAELGDALLNRYAAAFNRELACIEASTLPKATHLEAYAALYVAAIRNHRLCLCAVLAAEFDTLPEPMREGVKRFFLDSEAWLTRTVRGGRADGSIPAGFPEREVARLLIAGLEGAMLVTRPRHDHLRFKELASTLFAGLGLPLVDGKVKRTARSGSSARSRTPSAAGSSAPM